MNVNKISNINRNIKIMNNILNKIEKRIHITYVE